MTVQRHPVRVDPELGPERWCGGCQEWWPDDAEFWRYYTVPAGAISKLVNGVRYYRRNPSRIVRCRACYPASRRAPMVVGRVVETSDGTFLEPLQ